MRLTILTFVYGLLAGLAFAEGAQRAIVVSYPDGTPDNVLVDAKNAIKAAGGTITNEYKYIKSEAFSANVNRQAFETLQTASEEWHVNIEDDGDVHTA